MATGTYFTTAGPSVVGGLLLQAETRVRVGTSRLFSALETTSTLYTAYTAPIGLASGQGIDLGELDSVGLDHVPSFATPDTANVSRSSISILEEEETTITLGIRQFDVDVLLALVGTGVMYTVATNERLITVGGTCTAQRRPIEMAATNIGCNAPTSPGDVKLGVTAIVVTAYDCQSSSGLPLSELVAGDLTVMDTEWTVYPVNALAVGNRLFNLYIF